MALAAIREDADIPAETASHAVSLDGVMVPLRGEEGHKTIDWREASCATVSFHDSDGKRLRTIRHGRMPQSDKLDLKRWLAAEKTHNCGRRADLKLVAIADGAPDNWRFPGTPGARHEGLDDWHVCQHLTRASVHAGSPEAWLKWQKKTLLEDHQGVAKVIRALGYQCTRARSAAARRELETVLGYFRTNRGRMRYRALRDEKLSVGSGVVEAANKTLVTQRLKRSGMRWSRGAVRRY